jgi:hypothetical protein
MSTANPNPMETSMVSVLVVANAGGGLPLCVVSGIMALEAFQTAVLRLTENDDKHELYMHELNRKLVAVSKGETNAHDDDRMYTDDRFTVIESQMDILLQKMDATWTENTVLREAYHASREETVALKAAVDTLTKKLDETIATPTPPSPETATSPYIDDMALVVQGRSREENA